MDRHQTSDDQLREAITSSYSVSEAIRKLGKSTNGTNHNHYAKRVKALNLDTSHFSLRRKMRPQPYVGQQMAEVLVNNPDLPRRRSSYQVRSHLLFTGREYVCVGCGITDQWNGTSISLEIDHIDGDWRNNSPENLRFLCPNCHSQTPTHGSLRLKKPKAPKNLRRIGRQKKFCIQCGGECDRLGKTGLCLNCYQPSSKIAWPPVEELVARLKNEYAVDVAKSLGVSDNALKKYLQRRSAWTPRKSGPRKKQ